MLVKVSEVLVNGFDDGERYFPGLLHVNILLFGSR